MDGKGRYQDNICVERLWRTVKYEEVYLKAYASVLEAQRGLADYSRFYNGLRPHQAPGLSRGRLWATGRQPRCSTGSRMLWKGTLKERGVHRNRGPNHWQQSRDSHLIHP